MKKLFFLFTILGTLAFVSCSKDEVVTTGTIAGLVTDFTNANQPIAGATVTMNAKGIAKTTGSDGRYEFTDLEPGTYTLQAMANGYQPTTKQVTVYAGQTINCDFQLDKAAQSNSVVIEPENVVFGANMEQNSFTITNNTSKSLSYSISNAPSYIQVAPPAGNIAAKGKQAVMLTVLNRSTITAQQTGKLIVNVGSDSYAVSFTVEPYQSEQLNVSLSPTYLSFDKNTDHLSFTIRNNNSYDNNYTITSNIDYLTLTPASGTLTAKGQVQVGVTVKDRQTVTADVSGNITVKIGDSSFNVGVFIAKYEEDNPSDEPVVTRGMLAYYTFDDGTANNAWQKTYNGNMKGETTPDFITDTPNKKGKALELLAGQYVDIPTNMLSGKKAYTICMWVKQFGTGALFATISDGLETPSLYITENSKLKAYYYGYYHWAEWNTSLADYQSSGWHHFAVTAQDQGEVILYIDGEKKDSKSVSDVLCSGTKMQIGGNADGRLDAWTDHMKVDNVRVHSVALSATDVKQIYNAEK